MIQLANRIVDSFFDRRSIENPAVPLTSSRLLEYIGASNKTNSGLNVSNTQALTYSPVWQAVDLISGDISTLRLLTYEKDGSNRRRAEEHPTYNLLRRWSGELTSNLWLQLMMSNALLYGNGYSRIHRDGVGQAVRLEHIPAWQVKKVERTTTGQRVYDYQDRDDKKKSVNETDMFHLPGLMLSDLGGLSLVSFARNTIGRQLSAEGFTDEFFANGAKTSNWLKFPGKFRSNEDKIEWARKFRENNLGPGNRWKIPLLDEGAELVADGVNPKDALLIDQLSFGVKDIARFFKLPPHKLGDSAKTSYNAVEQENLAYYVSTLLYWATRIEHEANRKLFRSDEQNRLFVEFVVETFLRADSKTLAETQNIRILNGSLLRNEARAQQNQNPLPGGDDPLVPLNMGVPGENEPDGDTTGGEDDEVDPGSRSAADPVVLAARDLLRDGLEAAMRKVVNDAGRAAKKPDGFLSWINKTQPKYRKMFEGECRGPARVLVAVLGGDAGELVENISKMALDASANGLLEAAEVHDERLTESVEALWAGLSASCGTIADSALN